eukprot:4045505-Pyramimonas_sp.AAC.1
MSTTAVDSGSAPAGARTAGRGRTLPWHLAPANPDRRMNANYIASQRSTASRATHARSQHGH